MNLTLLLPIRVSHKHFGVYKVNTLEKLNWIKIRKSQPPKVENTYDEILDKEALMHYTYCFSHQKEMKQGRLIFSPAQGEFPSFYAYGSVVENARIVINRYGNHDCLLLVKDNIYTSSVCLWCSSEAGSVFVITEEEKNQFVSDGYFKKNIKSG